MVNGEGQMVLILGGQEATGTVASSRAMPSGRGAAGAHQLILAVLSHPPTY